MAETERSKLVKNVYDAVDALVSHLNDVEIENEKLKRENVGNTRLGPDMQETINKIVGDLPPEFLEMFAKVKNVMDEFFKRD